MRDFLTEYQQATLQVMGIQVWRLSSECTEESTNIPHTPQWLSDNKGFVADVTKAFDYIAEKMVNSQRHSIEWLQSNSEEFRCESYKVYAPFNVTSISSTQKRQLWLLIQQSMINDN